MIIFPLVFSIIMAGALFLNGNGLRESIVKSYIAAFLLIAASTEALSFFDGVTYDAIRLFWTTITVISLTVIPFSLTHTDPRASIKNWLRALPECRSYEAFSLLLITWVLFITLVVALVYPPNNWDSMTYHMARVAEWIQHGSIDVYPTSIDRQNLHPPFAEWVILHFQLLTASDRFANLVQWLSFLVSIVFATLIAQELQLPLQAQLFSAVVAATIPMAILESSSTQNDLVATSFCLGFAYFLLRFVRTVSLHDAIFCALTLGLALLTKGTTYFYCCAIGLTIGGTALLSKNKPKKPLLSRLALIVLAALVLNVGHFSRIYLVYGFSPSSVSDLANEEVSIKVTFSNLVRNGALHIGTPFELVNSYSFRAVRILLGDELNNPRSTMRTTTCCNFPSRIATKGDFVVAFPQTTASIPSFSLHEDYAGNLLHLILIATAFLILPFVTVSNKRVVYCYAGTLLFFAVLYCALFKWHPWATRLHTPLFFLSAPLIAAVFVGFHSFQRRLFICVAIILFVYSIPFLILNETRSFVALANNPILSTSEPQNSYFINSPNLYADYSAAAKMIMDEGAVEVGLCLGYDDYEYPLWVLVGRQASRGIPRFRHVGVADASKTKEKPNLSPPVLVVSTKRLDENPLHGKGRQAEDPCLNREHTVIFDSINMRIWKLKST